MACVFSRRIHLLHVLLKLVDEVKRIHLPVYYTPSTPYV